MENSPKKPQSSNDANNFSSPKSTNLPRKSAEERLKHTMKNLSYTSGGSNNLNVNLSKPTQPQSTGRRKVGGVVLDMDTIQEATNQKIDTRGRKSTVVIIILAVLLVISLVYLAVSIVSYFNNKSEPNCFYKINAPEGISAEWRVENAKDTEFMVCDGLGTDTIYLVSSSLIINSTDAVTIDITVKVTCEGKEVEITGLSEPNEKLLENDDGSYSYDGVISGGGTIHLFEGIEFGRVPSYLTSRNVVIEVTATLTKVA